MQAHPLEKMQKSVYNRLACKRLSTNLKKGIEDIMKNPAIFYGGIILAIVGIALGIFFLIPGINHVIADNQMHIKHALLFFGLGIIGIIGALVSRPKPTVS